MPRIRQQINDFVQRPGYQALKPKALAKKLGVTKKKMADFEAAIAEAEAAGDLMLTPSGRVQARRPPDTYIGVVRKVSSGDAFIILHEPKPTDIAGDVFIDRHDLKDAHSGDEVLIKLRKRRRSGGQRCGVIYEIVERATNVFVGTYFEEDDAGWVQIDGKDSMGPIWVGDPGAKGAIDGDKVVVEMVRFPAIGQIGEGVLTRVLGPRGEPGVDTQLVIHAFGLPDEFPESVLDAARLEAENFREDDLTDRDDLTGMLTVTIDPVDARDFDDAISVERWDNGHWHLGVHIADVSHFVQSGTELDHEAERRGNSVYLPTRVLPMLPEIISNGLASLQQDRVRFTMSAFMEFTAEGIPVSTRFSRSAIRVDQRFAYEEVMPLIASPKKRSSSKIAPEIRTLLKQMHELAMLLRRRRFERGALELEMPEIKLDFNQDGQVTGAHEAPHDESHQIIEEFMLAANIAVATELNDRGFHFLRRTHADPSAQKMSAFAEFAATLGYPIKKSQSRREIQKVLARVRGKPEERAINYALLRSLKQAEYSPVALGHYALAEEHYCHFTSPIRRYPDLLIHRLMLATLTGNKTALGPGMDEALRVGRHCSMTERRAERAERELTKIKLLSYLEDRIGERMEAVITGVDRFGFFCRGTELPAEGLVHISTISQTNYFDFDRTAMALISRGAEQSFRLGDHVTVEVVHVDVDRRELNFKLVTGGGKSGQRKPRQRTSGKTSSQRKRGPGKSAKNKKSSGRGKRR